MIIINGKVYQGDSNRNFINCSFGGEAKDVNVIEKSFDLPREFHQLISQNSFDVHLDDKASKKVTIKGSEDVIKAIQLRMVDDTLNIEIKNGVNFNSPINIYLSTSKLSSIRHAGSGTIEGKIKAENLNVEMQGSGELTLVGEINDLNLSVQGSGQANFKKLICKTVNISKMGSGSAKLSAIKTVNGQQMGSGSLKIFCNNPVNVKNMGSGSIKVDTFNFVNNGNQNNETELKKEVIVEPVNVVEKEVKKEPEKEKNPFRKYF